MGDIINLNRFRKTRERDAKQRQAAVNRSRFGRDNAEKARTETEEQRKRRLLEGSRIDNKDDSDPQAG